MNTTTLERNLQKARSKVTRLEIDAELLEKKISSLRLPFFSKIRQLEEQADALTERMRDRKRKIESEVDETAKKAQVLERQLVMIKGRTQIPTNDAEWLKLARYVEYFVQDPKEGPEECYSLKPLRAPNVEGFVILAASEGYAGSEKVYFAYTKSYMGAKLVGVMKVVPARHAGDNTYADAVIYGRRVFKNDWNTPTAAPLEKFIRRLKRGK